MAKIHYAEQRGEKTTSDEPPCPFYGLVQWAHEAVSSLRDRQTMFMRLSLFLGFSCQEKTLMDGRDRNRRMTNERCASAENKY